ncbi:hypothetical protein SAMN04488543_3699 [Friedmanniella luteola]|uniref:Uncharacterized protein n=1 Tax=Friedmanniella luteola TaxID=546871 RepID=A0A1H1ZDI6_9ACTN|nr:hypothetical protein [Friedmanniella luteola]SDT31669.1 hypothetical protein SAMN04488543_3699 [Friedmanniella luteola]
MLVPRPRTTALLVGTATAAVVLATAVPATAAVTSGPAITLRGSSSASSTTGQSVTVAKPAGTVAGDVLVARVANRGDVSAAMTSAGWSTVGSTQSAALLKSVVLVRVARAGEPASYTFDVSEPSNLAASVTAYDNVDNADPVDSFAGRVNGNLDLFTTPGVTSTVGNAMAVWFGTQLYSGTDCVADAITPPSGLTEVLDDCLAPGGSGLAIDGAQRQLGAAATRSGWVGSSDFLRTNVTQVLTLRPAAKVQTASRYAGSSVDVGKLWEGYDLLGNRDTALSDATLHEPSGLAASRVNEDVQYVHSESDVPGMVAVSTRTARVLGRYDVAIPDQWDWEDIATGPCPAGSCIFAGDIGRANGKPNPPSTFAVYRVAEPDLAAGETRGTLRGDWFRFRYPDAPHNAEAMMVHPVTGRIYVITKEEDGHSGVYAFPATLPAPSSTTVTTLSRVATLDVPTWGGDPGDTHAATWFAQVTAASIHPGGDRFLLRTPYRVYEYRAPAGSSFESAFDAAPVTLTAPSGESQGEAVEYAPDGSAYYTLGEREAPPFTLKRVDRR